MTRSSTTSAATLVAVLLISAVCAHGNQRTSASLTERLTAASKHQHYEPVGRVELRNAEALFVKTVNATDSFAQLHTQWKQLGWDLSQISSQPRSNDSPDSNKPNAVETIYVLAESSADIRGRGFFAFRPNATLQLAVQAPHCFYDRHTRRISLAMFESDLVLAGAWNTVKRSVVDAAHHRDTYINAFTRAFLQTRSRRAIVQLHGFAREKRKTAAGRRSDVIISNGTRFPGRLARSVSMKLTDTLDEDSVRLYPSQVEELGGTKNSQARIVHQHGRDNFVHIELSNEFRGKLRNRQALLKRFNTHLFSSFSDFRTDTR